VSLARSADLVQALAEGGVAQFCVCPGGRNAPIAVILSRARGIVVHTFFEERSAAFFALGRARATERPVAVVTTSGTAAAELLPAAVEAYYSGLPLVLVTADRPPAYRTTGGPQSIEQVGLFDPYAPTIFDGTGPRDRPTLDRWDRASPVHLNVCFDEPLIDGPIPELALTPAADAPPARVSDPSPLSAFLTQTSRPLVLVGPLDPADAPGVRAFLTRLGAPAHVEAASHLRDDPALQHLRLASGDGGVRNSGCEGILRIGGVPTVRLWRDLESAARDVPVCSVSRTRFPGLTHGTVIHGHPGAVLPGVAPSAVDAPWRDALLARDRRRGATLDALLAGEPGAEPSLLRALSALVPRGALVYLGNSLPIREWDLAAIREARDWRIGVNRGANGIDGQLSTFFGMCTPGREHWAVVGDLTALYDLAAPWALSQLDAGPIRIVIVNNRGGQIFARLSPHPELRNTHGIAFADWARMWNLAYERWDTIPDGASLPDRVVIELVPDANATARFWDGYDRLAHA
jgi:2-succinyl-5-enolpyruvyl-6-hydroxy-3-cyclohexene-1-carboxylate synthase